MNFYKIHYQCIESEPEWHLASGRTKLEAIEGIKTSLTESCMDYDGMSLSEAEEYVDTLVVLECLEIKK